jgi:3'(2'), 5'-bisphosphate nucleotidase
VLASQAVTEGDAELAANLARTAGAVLLDVRSAGLLDGKPLGAAGDAVSNALLMRVLAERRPGDGVLSEESADSPERLDHDRVWIVDPLDGTREYSEGRIDWAVHVALCIAGAPTPACAVAIPARGEVYAQGTRAAEPTHNGRLKIAVSRSRPPAIAERVAADLDAELVPLGSAGYKGMAVLTGEVDAYLHGGGQYEWDSAAPVGVALAAGLHASRIDGTPLRYNQPDPLLPDLLICRADLAERLLQAIASADQ